MTIHRFLADLIEVLAILVTVLGIFTYRKFSKELLPIFYFVAYGAINELFTDFYKAYVDRVTMPIGHIYLSISIVILVIFYLKVLDGYVRKRYVLLLGSLYVLYAIINPLFIQKLIEFPNILGAGGALLVVVLSILLFAKIMTEAEITNLRSEPIVWINAAFLMYYTGNFFYYILFNISVDHNISFALHTTILYYFLNIILYLMLAYSFILIRKKALALSKE